MWYWDYTPTGWGPAKPLSKSEIKKRQKAYAQADKISAEVKELEALETKDIESDLDTRLTFL